MESIEVPAPAKINLSLDIKGKLSDGYHEVEMIMQSIALSDFIKITIVDTGIEIETESENIPPGKNNLAYKAAEIFLKRTGIIKGVNIQINKEIPVAAGLAGGSTDAAAVLTGLNKLFGTNLKKNELYEMASDIGSDVSFCLFGGTALAYGRGEIIKTLPDIGIYNVLLIVPPVEVSTKEIYKEYDKIKPSANVPTDKLIKLIESDQEINWDEGWANVLEKVTIKRVDDIKRIKRKLNNFDILFQMMSGSGPAIFAIVKTKKKAYNIKKNWPWKKDRLFVTTTEMPQSYN